MLSDRCLSVLSVLSVTLVYCGQTVWWIKMKLGIEVSIDPGHIVLVGDPAPPPQKGHSPQFLAHVCCDQMAGWIKMPLGVEVGLGPHLSTAQYVMYFQFCRQWCTQDFVFLGGIDLTKFSPVTACHIIKKMSLCSIPMYVARLQLN